MSKRYGFEFFEGKCFSELYAEDTRDGAYGFFLLYPTTAHWSLFPNTLKYFMQDGSHESKKVGFDVVRQLEPWRMMAVLGETLPGVLLASPPKILMDYWKQHTGYSYDNLILLSAKDWPRKLAKHPTVKKAITLFPFDHLPADHHAVDPEEHYYLLGKQAMGVMTRASSPYKAFDLRMMPLERIELPEEYPFVIKTSHGLSGEGTYLIHNDVDLSHCLMEIRAYLSMNLLKDIVVMDYVANAHDNYCVQFYVDKEGGVKLLGYTSQLVTKQGHYLGGLIRYRELDMTRFFPIIDQVAKVAHLHLYFGVIGVDVMEDIYGQLHVIDINVRVNGSTPLCLHRNILLPLGKDVAKYSTRYRADMTLEAMMTRFKKELDQRDFIILSALEYPGEGAPHTDIYGIVTGKDVKNMLANEAKLEKKGLRMQR